MLDRLYVRRLRTFCADDEIMIGTFYDNIITYILLITSSLHHQLSNNTRIPRFLDIDSSA